MHVVAAVKRPVRLDGVVRVKELSEERARKQLALAQNSARQAKAEAEQAHQRMLQESRGPGKSEFWEMAESATERARAEHKKALERVEQAESAVDKARAEHLVARTKAEAVRRVAEARRSELDLEFERKETRRLDEVASIRFWRNRTER